MPLVVIKYKRNLKDIIETIAGQMPILVASALDVSEQEGKAGYLASGDIEVWCNEPGEFDVNTKDLEIIIWAHDFPARRATLEQRKNRITCAVRDFLYILDKKDSTGFVWILLQPSAFGEL